jgi:hypothetical protein
LHPWLIPNPEVVSKPSIEFKAKAELGVQPNEYIQYFDD